MNHATQTKSVHIVRNIFIFISFIFSIPVFILLWAHSSADASSIVKMNESCPEAKTIALKYLESSPDKTLMKIDIHQINRKCSSINASRKIRLSQMEILGK